MKNDLKIQTNPDVELVFNNYPDSVRSKMFALRKLVLDTAKEIDGITKLEENLKWGEPSYLTKNGSTLKMDRKAKNPEQYALYFKCTSRLVETFRLVFNNTLKYEGNRAIVFQLDDEIPTDIIKKCIKSTLTYHKVKHLPSLGL
jgi:hypothetical protein